jgi:hypothetical protein
VGENAEIAGRMVDVFNRLSVEEALPLCDPAVELTTLFDGSGEHEFAGHDGLRLWFERLARTWVFVDIRDWRVDEHGEWILVSGQARVRGRASPNEIELEWISAGKVAEGRFVKLGLYPSRELALRAIEDG